MAFLMALDMVELHESLAPLVDSLEGTPFGGEAGGFADYLAAVGGLYEGFGDELAVSVDYGPDGLELLYFAEVPDGAQQLRRVEQLFVEQTQGAVGLTVEGPSARQLDGLEVVHYRMELGPELAAELGGAPELDELLDLIYGPDGVNVHLASRGDVLMIAVGSEELARRAAAGLAAGPRPIAPTMRTALERVSGAGSSFVAHVDLRRCLERIAGLAASLGEPGVPPAEALEGPPVPVLAYGAIDGRRWHGGLQLDLGKLVAFGRALEDL